MNWRTIACSTTATFLLGACAYPPPPPPSAQPEGVVESPQPAMRWIGTRFEDIPIPSEFSLDYEASYLDTSPGAPRVADLRYIGESSPSDVLNQIQPAMLQAGWQSTSLTGVAIKTLRHRKGGEECVLVIHKGADGGTVIMVRLHPRAAE